MASTELLSAFTRFLGAATKVQKCLCVPSKSQEKSEILFHPAQCRVRLQPPAEHLPLSSPFHV